MTSVIQPQWIAKMYPGKVGRDHLGLGSVSSDQILPRISPSINVLTFHPRYHSFYAFLLDEFWRRDRPRSRKALVEFYRPREFIFSVGAHICDNPEHGQMQHVVGGQKVSPMVGQHPESYDSKTHYIDAELGGYGLYYRTVMIELGIVIPGGPGFPIPIDVPSEFGKQVAEAFRKGVIDTRYYKEYFDTDEISVPTEVIKEYIRKACLCQVQTNKAPDRPLLLEAFLKFGGQTSAASRKSTIQLFLDLSQKTAEHSLDEHLFRQLIYFKKSQTGIVYQPAPEVESTYLKWRLYQAREYYSFALNALWFYLCDWGILQGGDIRSIPIDQFYLILENKVDFNKLAGKVGLPPPNLSFDSNLSELLKWILNTANTTQEDFDGKCGIDFPLNENSLYQLAIQNRAHPDVNSMVTGMITMLILIYLRFCKLDLWTKPEWDISRMGTEGRLSLDLFIRSTEKNLKSGHYTIKDFIIWLYEVYVIFQHQLVALRKLPDNTFRFRREGNKLRFFNIFNTLDFLNSRFEAISTTISELGFSGNFYQQNHIVTRDGLKLLETGEL